MCGADFFSSFRGRGQNASSPFSWPNHTFSVSADPVQLKGDKDSRDFTKFWKVSPKNIRSEEEECEIRMPPQGIF